MTTVRSIETSDFMGHVSVKLDLPERGVVVVTGGNGAGKSTLIEAVAVALWGRTIRGTPWNREGATSRVRLETDSVLVERDRDGDKLNAVRWGLSRPLRTFETATRAQEELDPLVGPMDAWRRAAVFSSQDVLTFALATDGERKRLLEGMLGLDVFDRGLVACRAELARVRALFSSAETRVSGIASRLEVERKRLADATASAGPEPERVSAETIAELARSVSAAGADRRRAAQSKAGFDLHLHRAEETIARARRELAELAGEKTCSRCGQALSDEAREKLGRETADALRAAEDRLPELRERSDAGGVDAEELEVEHSALSRKLATLQQRAAVHKAWAEGAARRNLKVDEVRHDVEALELDLAAAVRDVDAQTAELRELEVVEKILGLRGVRTLVVARALAGLETVTNAWLDRLAPGVSIKLSIGADARGGNRTNKHDTIELIVRGLDNGGQYRACSGGERRRVDVALLLALADVWAAGSGRDPGTLWFDEVFDTLDEEGISCVGDALRDVSRDRCVVVITHSETLAAEIDAVARWTLRDGALER